MTLLTLGLAEELKSDGISACTLWPQTTIATAAIEFALDPKLMKRSRTPRIMADAALEIILNEKQEYNGKTLVDEALLSEKGMTDFDQYKVDSDCDDLMRDLYLDK